jgi:transcriptional regulator with XRE-family HTH domain
MTKTVFDNDYRACVTQLRSARKRLNLTQTQAGRLIGKSRNWMSKVETFEVRLDVLFFVRLCRALGIRPDKLIREMDKELP